MEQLKSRIQITEATITDLIRSLKFSHAEVVRDLQNKIRILKKSDVENKAMIDILKLRLEELEKKSNYQEDYNRRNNIRITSIMEQHGGET